MSCIRACRYPYCFSEFSLPKPYGKGPTTQWAWPSFNGKTYNVSINGRQQSFTVDDDWCNRDANVVKPLMLLHAHTSPLGMEFFGGWRQAGRPCTIESTPDPVATLPYRYTFVHAAGVEDGLAVTPTTTQVDAFKTCPDRAKCVPEGQSPALPCAWWGDLFLSQHGSWNRKAPAGYQTARVQRTGGVLTGEIERVLAHNGARDKWERNTRPVDAKFDAQSRLFVSSDSSGDIIMLYHRSFDPARAPVSAHSAASAPILTLALNLTDVSVTDGSSPAACTCPPTAAGAQAETAPTVKGAGELRGASVAAAVVAPEGEGSGGNVTADGKPNGGCVSRISTLASVVVFASLVLQAW